MSGWIDDKDDPAEGKCPIEWKVGDTAWDGDFALGEVVRITPNGWPVVRIMKDIEETSWVCTPQRGERK